jgi:hypothetical protein
MEHVQHFEIEAKPVSAHDDVIGMEVSMIFAEAVDALDSDNERMEEVE